MFGTLKSLFARWRPTLAGAFHLFEAQVCYFPILVTVFASLALLLGGRIMAWQWWIPTLLIYLYPWIAEQHEDKKQLILNSVLFTLLLIGTWLITNILPHNAGGDGALYHLPSIRALIEGWNPIFVATPEAFEESMGLDPEGMRYWHALSNAKTTWYFSAVAYSFTKTPLNLLSPLLPFLVLSSGAQIWRFLRPTPRAIRLLALIVVLPPFIVGVNSIVTATVYLCALGLLSTMGIILRGGPIQKMPLIVHSFWLITAKSFGLWTGLLFWSVFSLYLAWQHRRQLSYIIRPFSIIVGVLLFLFCITSASPYFTNWVNYGHPLYPQYTTDESRFPSRDIVSDFKCCNEDAEAMGHIGSFINAYISQTLAYTYYKWHLGQDTFSPMRSTWNPAPENPASSGDPTNRKTRLFVVGCTLFILCFGKRPERLLMLMILLTMIAVPSSMLGYTRYIPHYLFLFILVLSALGSWRPSWKRTLLYGILALGCLRFWAFTFRTVTYAIDNNYHIQAFLDSTPNITLYPIYISWKTKYLTKEELDKVLPREAYGPLFYNTSLEIKLLQRQESRLSNTRITVFNNASDYETLVIFPNFEFYVDPAWQIESSFLKNMKIEDRKQRFLNYPRIFLNIYSYELPSLVGRGIKKAFTGGS